VILGNLPDDFLRFDGVGGNSALGKTAASQLELDEQAARSLHHELNAQTGGAGVPMSSAFYAAAGAGAGFVPANTKGRLSICLVQVKWKKYEII